MIRSNILYSIAGFKKDLSLTHISQRGVFTLGVFPLSPSSSETGNLRYSRELSIPRLPYLQRSSQDIIKKCKDHNYNEATYPHLLSSSNNAIGTLLRIIISMRFKEYMPHRG